MHAFINEGNTLPRLCKLFHLKMTRTSSYTDEVRVKVPSLQKVKLFLRYKIFNRDVINLHFCLFEDVTDYHDLRRINLNVSIGLSVFFLHNNIRQKLLAAYSAYRNSANIAFWRLFLYVQTNRTINIRI